MVDMHIAISTPSKKNKIYYNLFLIESFIFTVLENASSPLKQKQSDQTSINLVIPEGNLLFYLYCQYKIFRTSNYRNWIYEFNQVL